MTDANVYYDPVFTGQLNSGLATAKEDCGFCAERHAVRRHSLGTKNPSIPQMRQYADVITGQPRVDQLAVSLERLRVDVAGVYTRYDSFSTAEVRAWLEAGNYLIALGDYDEVPLKLKGDREFMLNHYVYANAGTDDGPQIYDSLDDGRVDQPSGIRAPQGPIIWPWAVFDAYLHGLSDKFDLDVTVITIRRRSVERRFAEVLVRPGPAETGLVGRWHTGPLEYGSIVLGAEVYGDRRWFRVWWPYEGGRVGFVAAAHVLIHS